MEKSQLEKYYAKGWLVYGDKNISSEERLAAALLFGRSMNPASMAQYGCLI